MGTRQLSRGRKSPRNRVENKLSLPEKSKPIAEMPRSSTGPRTQTGKRMVAKNALKHGFFSKWLLIPHPDGKEDPTEYQNLYAALRVHYQPLDFLEELWVEKIAVWSWH